MAEIILPDWAREVRTRFRGFMKGDAFIIKTCPYCGNTHANLELSISKCLFHCWSCDAGGGVRTFLKQFEISFEPEDVKPIAYDVLRHRILLTYEAEAEQKTSDEIITKILEKIKVP